MRINLKENKVLNTLYVLSIIAIMWFPFIFLIPLLFIILDQSNKKKLTSFLILLFVTIASYYFIPREVTGIKIFISFMVFVAGFWLDEVKSILKLK